MDKAVVRDLATLVAFPSVSNRPLDDLAAHLSERFADLGFTIGAFQDPRHPGKRNLVCRAGPRGTEGLVLSGHMDVVPTEGQPWSSDPFTLTERDGLLYGRGAADMKGFFAATLAAVARLDVRKLRHELVLVWTHDEEVGCLGSAILADQLLARGETLPKACLIGEPTGFRVLRMHPGHVAMQVTLPGRAAHSSRPDLGVNAIEAAARAVIAVRAEADRLAAEHADLPELERPWVAVNVATIQGGAAINIVPDQCVVQIGYRPLPGQDPHAVFHRLMGAIHEVAPDAVGQVLRMTPAMLTGSHVAHAATLLAHADHAGCGAATFATDGGNLAKLGLEPLIFGPGHIEVAHQADEHLAIADLVRAVDVLEAIVRERCERPANSPPA